MNIVAKHDKRAMQNRLDGMIYAWDKIKREGLEAFEKELKMRKGTFVQLEVDSEKVNQIFDMITTRIYNSFTVGVYKTLNDEFEFGEVRMKRFRDAFNEICKDLMTVDGYGERLYCFYDYADEFNKKYHLDINIDAVQEVDNLNDEHREKRASIKSIRELLEQFHFSDAAEFLKKYIEGDEIYGQSNSDKDA